VAYITERGNRVAGIAPAELAFILEQFSADDFNGLATAAEAAGLTAVADPQVLKDGKALRYASPVGGSGAIRRRL
jgi:hypothetical protein